jgi:hypothetical protein
MNVERPMLGTIAFEPEDICGWGGTITVAGRAVHLGVHMKGALLLITQRRIGQLLRPFELLDLQARNYMLSISDNAETVGGVSLRADRAIIVALT